MSEPVQDEPTPALESLRVLLVDDHDLFRTGLRNLLEEQGVQVVGEAAAGAEALRLTRELAPDVVVMDLNMPGMSGVEATRQITARRAAHARARADDLRPGRRRDGRDPRRRVRLPAQGRVDPGADARDPGGRAGRVADLAAHRLEGAAARAGVDHLARDRGDDPLRALRPRDRGAEADRERQGQRPDRRASSTSARRRSRTTSRTS